jgi:hypothetical protein
MANPTVYAPSGQSINQSIVSSLVERKWVEQFVVEQFPEYHVINTIQMQLGGVNYEKVGKRKYETPRVGNTYPASPIAARSLTGGVLTLNWEDPTATPFRKDEVIMSETGVAALCIESQNGVGKFIFQYSKASEATTAFVTADFAVGESASGRGSMPNVSSGQIGTERKVITPYLEYNYIPMYQETASFNYEEAAERNELPGGWWIESQIYQAMQRISESYAVNQYDSARSARNGIYTNDGFEQQIFRAGGIIEPFYGDLAQINITSFIDKLKANGAAGSEYLVLGGYDYLGMLQRNVFQNYITYVGINNTIGGKEVKGIDVHTFSYNGITVKFVEEKMFSNPNMFTTASAASAVIKQARKAFWFNTAPVRLANGKGTVSFLQGKKYGNMDMVVADFPGYIGKDGNMNVAAAKARSLEFTTDVIYNKTQQLTNAASCGVHIGN